MTFFLAMICISVGFMVNLQAQSIIISVDGKNPEADTLNFGSRTENNPKVDSFLVVNNTSDTLLIPISPMYLNRVNPIPFDNSFAEFEFDTIQQLKRPFIILPQSIFPIKINFKVDTADKGVGFEKDLSLKRARVFINICKYGDTNDIKASDTIHLIGDRTARFMKPSDSVMVFDTMYIGTSKKDTLIVYNGTSNQALSVKITQSQIVDNININPTDIGNFTLPPHISHPIPIEYTVKSLSDSVKENVLRISSSPGAKFIDEESNIDIKAFVAYQKIEIDKEKTGNLIAEGKVEYFSDTSLMFLDTVEVGSSKLFEIVVKNTGNIPIIIDSVIAEGTLKNNFIVDINPTINIVQPNSSTLLNVLFSPKLNGPIKTNIVVYTKLKSLFPDIVSNDEKQYITLTGNGVSGDFFITENENCKSDTVLFSDSCTSTCSNTLNLSNFTKTSITINKIDFTGDVTAFRFDPPLNSTINLSAGETKIFTVHYVPNKKQNYFNGSLSFITEGKTETIEVDYYSASPEATIASETIFASPGDSLSIPIIAKTKNASIQLADYFRLRMFIPKQHLNGIEYIKFTVNPNIRPKRAEITDNITIDGQLIFISTNDGKGPFLIPSDTLGTLHLKYYLNEHMTSEIVIDSFFLGSLIGSLNGGLTCDSIYQVLDLPKIIIKAKENSFCADQETLNSLFNDIRNQKFGFSAMMPMSGESVVEIQHLIPNAVHADISLYAVTGEKVETIFSGIAPKELTKFRHPLSHLSKGVYYCELKTGTFRKTVPIIISQ